MQAHEPNEYGWRPLRLRDGLLWTHSRQPPVFYADDGFREHTPPFGVGHLGLEPRRAREMTMAELEAAVALARAEARLAEAI